MAVGAADRRWDKPKDRTLADRVQSEILDTLAALSRE
jgi:hypothetical protein